MYNCVRFGVARFSGPSLHLPALTFIYKNGTLGHFYGYFIMHMVVLTILLSVRFVTDNLYNLATGFL